ncbi:MAG: mannose-1-phosphate guanyltransferase, partial [Planctomycetales bacterium]|nr:mannose-1-phosphate guanyltransferase [Planctomycetales bacterium]
SWQAMARIRGTNADGNTIAAKRYLGINTKGSIIRSTDEHLVVTIGLEDVLVVHTSDATLVAKKSDEEAVRDVVSQLQEKKWNAYL